MHITCPRCLRSLSTADPHGPPVFCMYCGQKLRDTDSTPLPVEPVGNMTASFVPFSADPEAVSEPVPTAIGGYRLVRLIGAGGMGTVYEAEAPESGNRVAVKLLSSRLASSPTSVERFRQEGRLASQLTHPRCVFVLAADTDAGRPYIVMELMPGRTLKDIVDQDGPLPHARAIAYILDVIDGLTEAHRLGVLHRDVKPSNCFLAADGRVKIGDFGLSKSLADSGDRHITRTGTFLGTVLFASPEQIRGEALDYGSDVYSVCATLYYLLCGEAPFHHENMAAALARAISEPVPSICDKKPDVPRDLERVLLRGLERDRDRRWQTLEELREALVALLPNRQPPARRRMLIGAYLLDRIAVFFLVLPIELIYQMLLRLISGEEYHIRVELVEFRPSVRLFIFLYFAIGDGVFGATPGKWLLGLRVSRVGQTGPPGFWRGLLRSVVFGTLFYGMFACVGLSAIAKTPGEKAIAVAGSVLAAAALLVQFRRTSGGYRGLHDFASSCHVTQRPLPERKLRLVSHRPNPLDAVLRSPARTPDPAEPVPLPETLGGYAIRGRVNGNAATGEQLWAAEDRVLGRKVVLWLRPEQTAPTRPREERVEVSRPGRLRRLGWGKCRWADRGHDWTAFAAPLGVPLADTITPGQPLPWADARFLLEQLVDELLTAEADGSTPNQLGINQVWVEPNGRLQVLDFPIDAEPPGTEPLSPERKRGGDHSPSALLRELVSLTLEGRPRTSDGPVHAPVPPHAAPVLRKLFEPDGYPTLAELHCDLAETHTHAPEVTPAIRGAQLGIQAAVLALGLAVMFGATGLLAVILTKMAEVRASQIGAVLAALNDPAQRAELPHDPELARAVSDPHTIGRLEHLRDAKTAEAEFRRRLLLAPQRFLLERFEAAGAAPDQVAADARTRRDMLLWAAEGRTGSPWEAEAAPVWVALLIVPLAWVVIAALLRGGMSMVLTGITVVRADGRPASRRQCALRTALVWLPVTAVLAGCVWLQDLHPDRPAFTVALWLGAVALLPVYVVVALWNPSRPPQDRAAGTYLVPV